MLWNYLSLLVITWTVSQLFKWIFKPHTKKSSLQHIKNTFLFYSGPPSSHSAILAMTLLYVRHKTTVDDPVFIVFIVFSILWIYEIYMQRKRFRYLIKLLEIDKDKEADVLFNKEFHGHELFDILSGLALGTAIYYLFN